MGWFRGRVPQLSTGFLALLSLFFLFYSIFFIGRAAPLAASGEADVGRSARSPIGQMGDVAGAPWVTVRVASQLPKWKVESVVYLDPERAQGDRNIYVTLLNASGSPVNGIVVYLDTGVPADRGSQVTKSGGACDFPQTGDSTFFPDQGQHGPYNVFVGGMASDWVMGMGLPVSYHVVYSITFRQVLSDAPTLTPIPAVTPFRTVTPSAASPYLTRRDLAGALRSMADYLDSVP